MRLFLSLSFLLAGILLPLSGAESEAAETSIKWNGTNVTLPPESVTLSTGETRKFEVPFQIEHCKSSTANAKVSLIDGRSFELEGVSVGNAVVTASANGMKKEFRVTVSSSVMQIYRELSRELGDLPEVGVELSDNVLTLRGEITKLGHWEYFRRVVKRYEERCHNYVTFRPGPALFTDLKMRFESAGFKIADTVSPDAPGQLKFQVSIGLLTVSGYLLCENDIAAV